MIEMFKYYYLVCALLLLFVAIINVFYENCNLMYLNVFLLGVVISNIINQEFIL